MQEASSPGSDCVVRREAVPANSTAPTAIKSEVAFIALPGTRAGWAFGMSRPSTTARSQNDGASLSAALGATGYDARARVCWRRARSTISASRARPTCRTCRSNSCIRGIATRSGARLTGSETVSGVDATRVRVPRAHDADADPKSRTARTCRAWSRRGSIRRRAAVRAEVKTFASLEQRESDSSLRVEFAEHKALDMLVPTEMRETFATGCRARHGVATLHELPTLQTSARIVPQ